MQHSTCQSYCAFFKKISFVELLSDIIKKVIAGSTPPYRPLLNEVNEVAPECVLHAIRACWAEDPFDRPNFLKTREMLAPLQKGL